MLWRLLLSIGVLQFSKEFLLQMASRRFFDRAPLSGDGLLLCLPLSPGSFFK
jgi:hypothetical protein